MQLDLEKRPEKTMLPKSKAPGSCLCPNAFHTSAAGKALLLPGSGADTPRGSEQGVKNRLLLWATGFFSGGE